MDERARRLGENEAIFREVNERLRDVGESFSLLADESQFICECADPACTEPIAMTLDKYEEIRSHPARFAVVRGHEVPDIERIVEDTGTFLVIEKHAGPAAELARERDPRD
jgi:hypothetical protein